MCFWRLSGVIFSSSIDCCIVCFPIFVRTSWDITAPVDNFFPISLTRDLMYVPVLHVISSSISG